MRVSVFVTAPLQSIPHHHHHQHHHHHHFHHHHFRLLDGMTERKPIHVDKQYRGNKMTSANNSFCTSYIRVIKLQRT